MKERNVDPLTVEGFGREWSRFDQFGTDEAELRALFEQYFSDFPWDLLPQGAEGFDLGCGSGRWAKFVAPRVGRLHCIDASMAALEVARRALSGVANCELHHATVDAIPLPDASQDFGYSLGVLHHVPKPFDGIYACARKLKRGAPLLLYLYYAFDHRPWWFRLLWRLSDFARRLVARLPFALRARLTDVIAALVYWPLARLARMLERTGMSVDRFPLSAYRSRSFYIMRNDALDRFGTRLERRFSRLQIEQMLQSAGFGGIAFREAPPYWCVVGIKK